MNYDISKPSYRSPPRNPLRGLRSVSLELGQGGNADTGRVDLQLSRVLLHEQFRMIRHAHGVGDVLGNEGEECLLRCVGVG